jgi:SAM-dependent methyltransferase
VLSVGQKDARSAETVYASKTLAQFLTLLFSRSSAELVDLGPVVGANVAFLGERIGCKIHVEDLYADLDRYAREDALDRLPEFLERRFAFPDASADAVLCWDIFDYLAPAAASVLANELMRVLRPGGALLGFFSGGGPDDGCYTKYVIEDEASLRLRCYPAACNRERVLQNREITNLFAGLELVASILLKSGVREVLFRKRDDSRPGERRPT